MIFRLFSQTAVSLLHDQKGWDIIGEVLANPELIENFTGGGGDVDNGTKSARKSLKALTSKLENVGEENGKDGDFGVDFSTLVDELSTKSERTMKKDGEPTMPEIAESVDYYSSVSDHLLKLGSCDSRIFKEIFNSFLARLG